jgi:hypothetical protein
MVSLKTLLLFTVFSALLLGCGITVSYEEADKPEIAYEKEEHEICEEDSLLMNPNVTYGKYHKSDYGCIKGKIVDDENNSIPLAEINIIGTKLVKLTNGVGKYKIRKLDPGFYDLRISHSDFRNTRIESIEVIAGKTVLMDTISIQSKPLEQLIDDLLKIQAGKPIIYLYPETVTNVAVKLDFSGKVTHTYPKYGTGWNVEAHPDGTIFDENGKEYYALYWEGDSKNIYTVNEGFVIRGEETIEFLEKALDQLGLNRKEANEFIIYWLPKLENNPYNLIHFSTSEYTEMAKLIIDPSPETIIRIMMVFKPLDEPIKIKEQNLDGIKKERKGFTVVEWGGTLVN